MNNLKRFIICLILCSLVGYVFAQDYTSDVVPAMTSNTAPSGEVTGSSGSGGTDKWKAFDDIVTGYWQPTTAACWLKYDFGSGVTKTAVRYTVYLGNYDTYGIRDFTLEGSNNDSDWDVLDTQTSITWSVPETKTFTFANTTAYRYYMLDVTANNGAGQSLVYEMELMALAPEEVGQFIMIQ